MSTDYDIEAKQNALVELTHQDVEHVDDYEFRTPEAVYFVLDADEADAHAVDEVERRDGFDYELGRGWLLAVDRQEHAVGDYFIYRQCKR